jgi:hypothetical protein
VRLAKYIFFGADRRFRLSFTFDLYNLFNRHRYQNPVTDIASDEFGYVPGIEGAPRRANSEHGSSGDILMMSSMRIFHFPFSI